MSFWVLGRGILPIMQRFLRKLLKAPLLIDNYYRLRYYNQFVIGAVGIGQVGWQSLRDRRLCRCKQNIVGGIRSF